MYIYFILYPNSFSLHRMSAAWHGNASSGGKSGARVVRSFRQKPVPTTKGPEDKADPDLICRLQAYVALPAYFCAQFFSVVLDTQLHFQQQQQQQGQQQGGSRAKGIRVVHQKVLGGRTRMMMKVRCQQVPSNKFLQ
jgi:hypothetical protein